MSAKKIHTAAFYLVDANDYKTFAQLKEENVKLEKKIAELMKYRDLHSSALQSHFESKINELHSKLKNKNNIGAVSTETLEPSEDSSHQIGAGQLTEDIDSDAFIQKRLLSAFENFLENHKQSQGQTGGGDDTTPLLPIRLEEPSTAPSDLETIDRTAIAHLSENSSHSAGTIDSNQLISLVPTSSKRRALELIKELKQYSSDLSFCENGEVILKGQVVPNVNATQLFSQLYRPIKNNNAVVPIVDEIASLGLGHLIARPYTRGLTPRGASYLKNRAEIKQNLHPSLPWYYISNND